MELKHSLSHIRSINQARSFFKDRIIYTSKILYYRLRYPSESVFSVIHRKRAWGHGDSSSGGGSDLVETHAIRSLLPKILAKLDVQSILDAPCGDFYWMSQIELSVEKYIGVDIVESIIKNNIDYHASDSVIFQKLDISKDPLPRADLILCRDCMVHMSNSKILLTLKNFKQSGAKYLLATTYPNTVNRNKPIFNGMWRYLDLEKPPFNFPSPLKVLTEETKEIYQAKSLGLWKIEDLPI
jgi:hypothetical protein